MTPYIDKDAVVLLIQKIYDNDYKFLPSDIVEGVQSFKDDLLMNLDTLEVKEVDEVKIGETQIYLEDDGGEQPYDGKQWFDLSCTEYEIPKALFKDGDNVEIFIRKAQKGE